MLLSELPGKARESSRTRKSEASARWAKPEEREGDEDERDERQEREVGDHGRQVGPAIAEELREQIPFAQAHCASLHRASLEHRWIRHKRSRT